LQEVYKMKKNQNFSRKDVISVASLARLKLSEKEIAKFQKQLSEILQFVNSLLEVKTENVSPTSQVTGLTNVFREDIVKPSLSQKEVLKNAPGEYKGYFKVKAVLNKS